MSPWMAIAGFIAAIFGGGTGVALINGWMNRKATNATGTSTLEKASERFRDEVRKDNADMREEMREVKIALINLADLVAEFLPLMTTLSDEQRKSLQAAVLRGKLAA